jgi:hypothetical protein
MTNIRHMLIRLFHSHESSNPAKERDFIRHVLVGNSPDVPPGLDWKRLKEIAQQEGVLAILYRYLKKKDIPQSALLPLKRYYHDVVAQNFIALDTLKKLEHTLGPEKIEIMTLKGASLLDHAYPGVGMRPMSDLDLMVLPEAYERFIRLLFRQGYEPDSMIPHYLHKGRSVIDVHIHALNADRITNRAELFPSGMEPVWANSLPQQEGYQWVRRPDDVDNTILLAQHLMKHSFSSLIWIVDICMLVKNRDSAFWTRLAKRADQLDQTRPLSYALYLTKGLFGVEPPRGCQFDNLNKDLSWFEREILGARIKGQTLYRLGPLMALFCLPGFKARVTFLWETVFPQKAVIEQEFQRLHRGKRLLFYPGRILQIVALAIRQLWSIIGTLVKG